MELPNTYWLVWRLSALGDVLLTTGPLAWWARNRGWRFVVVTREIHAPIFEANPYVEDIIHPAPEDLQMPRLAGWLKQLAKRYEGWGFIDLHGTGRSRLASWIWRGPVLRYPKESFARRVFLRSGGRFYGRRLREFPVIRRYAMAVDLLPPPVSELLPRLWLRPTETAWAEERLTTMFPESFPSEFPVALHPYAAHSMKAWPKQYWRRLVELLDAAGISWLAVGRGKPLFPNRPEDLTNQTDLRQSAALFSRCRVLVSGDSGPMHLAGAVGVPVVALFGPTTREWGFFPQGARDIVLQADLACRPCSLHGKKDCPRSGECMALIRPEQVITALAGC